MEVSRDKLCICKDERARGRVHLTTGAYLASSLRMPLHIRYACGHLDIEYLRAYAQQGLFLL